MTDLHLYDHSDNLLRRMGYAEVYCEDFNVVTGQCYRNRPGILHAAVSSIEEVRSWILTIGVRVRTINSIWFHTHGRPGYIQLLNGGIHTGNVYALHLVCSQYLSMPANIYFLGCNVGEGSCGEQFLRVAGRAMLTHGGGSVFAADSKTSSTPWSGQTLPIWGNPVVAEVQHGGAVQIHHP